MLVDTKFYSPISVLNYNCMLSEADKKLSERIWIESAIGVEFFNPIRSTIFLKDKSAESVVNLV